MILAWASPFKDDSFLEIDKSSVIKIQKDHFSRHQSSVSWDR